MSFLTLPDASRPLGASPLIVSPLAWGMWRFRGTDLVAADRLVRTALDAGLTLFDTADVYGPDNGEAFGAAEALLGAVLAADGSLRGRMMLASKGGAKLGLPYDSGKAYLVAACEASLRRLRTDHLDLYHIHRPDLLTHPQDMAAALEQLRRDGKIREAGVANFTAAETRALAAYMPFRLASIQPEFSALALAPLTDVVLDLALEMSLGVMALSPLAGGRLAGAATDRRLHDVTAALDVVASRQQVGRAAVAYAWLLAHPSRPVPIVGSQTPAHIQAAAQAPRVRMTRAEWYGILAASRQERRL
jgi:predicted oxidoreductase